MDFYRVRERQHVKGRGREPTSIDIYPDFQVVPTKDLMVRAKSFYAVWDEERGLWSRNEYDVARLVDAELYSYRDLTAKSVSSDIPRTVLTLASYQTGMWTTFRNYISRMPDNAHDLDECLTFQNTEVKKEDYVSRRLPYSLEAGDYSAWDKLVSTLYDPPEREKIEWAIGSIVSGDSKKIEKFVVFYGEHGSGKSTIIRIIQQLFDGYYTTFDAKALGSSGNQFATEVFRTNPLVAIQHDGDLSRIEDNTKINSIVSHEEMTINEKNKPQYTARANCFLFMGSNKPVRITDGYSGILRRLIDIHPSGRRIPRAEYDALKTEIGFQLGAIAQHCLDIYRERGKGYYDAYEPRQMQLKTDFFYNFVEAKREELATPGGISLTRAYELWKKYRDDAELDFKFPRHKFREELKMYFRSFEELGRRDGKQVRSWFDGFREERLGPQVVKKPELALPLVLDSEESLLDRMLAECPAQYAKEDGSPQMAWSNVTTKLKDLDTTKLHWVRVPENHIVIDFDLKDESGNKNMLMNLEAASKWPKTYAEFSKGGCGIHLHYIYDGDVSQLAAIYETGIEVKVYRGFASLRRKLSKCNTVPVAHISSGLPLKEEKKVVDVYEIKDDKHIHAIIRNCLRKKHFGATKPEVDLIVKTLNDAWEKGLSYNLLDLQVDIFQFAAGSTHQSDYCRKAVRNLPYIGKPEANAIEEAERRESLLANADVTVIVLDCEVYPNFFGVAWKPLGKDEPVRKMYNPTPNEVEELFSFRIITFNGRRYDNHILYGRYLGMSNEELYDLSKRIVGGAKDAMFPQAYDISWTDVFDYASKKQGLKKWEIELGIHHQEMGIPWDQPVPEALWEKVMEYCANDVLATEAVWEATQPDFIAREILADITGMTVNDTTNSLTGRWIFEGDRHPQKEFNYRFMGIPEEVATA